MRKILYKAIPWRKEEVTLALESGVDGIICPDDAKDSAASLARGLVLGQSEVAWFTLSGKEDEEAAAALGKKLAASGQKDGPRMAVLCRGWEIIPLENILAETGHVAVEAGSLDEARLAAGVLERGAETIVITPEGVSQIKEIMPALKNPNQKMDMVVAEITRIEHAGMGHRVCVDTTSILKTGQGMLVGNSAAFTFLVNAETEHNEYVAARPFRINAGGVHAYTVMPEDRTSYLEELKAGAEILIVGHDGNTFLATVGRVKIERRPMLLIEARIPGAKGEASPAGGIFLQNAETIRLVRPDGKPVSVVELKAGDKVLCRSDVAGRHFGIRIAEDIKEG